MGEESGGGGGGDGLGFDVDEFWGGGSWREKGRGGLEEGKRKGGLERYAMFVLNRGIHQCHT